MARPPRVTGFLSFDALLAGRWDVFVDHLRHLILPAVTLSLGGLATIVRFTRAGMLDNPMARRQAQRIVQLLDLAPGMRVLDVGAGVGRLSLPIAAKVGPNGEVPEPIGNDTPPAIQSVSPLQNARHRCCAIRTVGAASRSQS